MVTWIPFNMLLREAPSAHPEGASCVQQTALAKQSL